jgi:leader peptidase (prepilin peptidase)/N-methyltransferase
MILLSVWLLLVFLLGASVGSFLNVCIVRIPHYEKSVLWPGSHCFNCFQPIRRYDNLPLVSSGAAAAGHARRLSRSAIF